MPAKPKMPDPNSMLLLGSGVELVVLVVLVMLSAPSRVKDSDGIVPIEFSEAEDRPEFSS
jgi:hypothetical protein